MGRLSRGHSSSSSSLILIGIDILSLLFLSTLRPLVCYVMLNQWLMNVCKCSGLILNDFDGTSLFKTEIKDCVCLLKCLYASFLCVLSHAKPMVDERL